MFALLYDPLSEIKKARKQSYAKIFLYLLTAALFETVGLLFIAWRYFPEFLTANTLVTGIFAFLFGCIIAHLVVAFFFGFAMHILDGKGGYYEALACLVLAMIAPAVSIFFAGALTYIPYGIYLALTLVTYGYVVGAATLFRAGKELFELDYAGVLIGFLITAIPMGIALGAALILL